MRQPRGDHRLKLDRGRAPSRQPSLVIAAPPWHLKVSAKGASISRMTTEDLKHLQVVRLCSPVPHGRLSRGSHWHERGLSSTEICSACGVYCPIASARDLISRSKSLSASTQVSRSDLEPSGSAGAQAPVTSVC